MGSIREPISAASGAGPEVEHLRQSVNTQYVETDCRSAYIVDVRTFRESYGWIHTPLPMILEIQLRVTPRSCGRSLANVP